MIRKVKKWTKKINIVGKFNVQCLKVTLRIGTFFIIVRTKWFNQIIAGNYIILRNSQRNCAGLGCFVWWWFSRLNFFMCSLHSIRSSRQERCIKEKTNKFGLKKLVCSIFLQISWSISNFLFAFSYNCFDDLI